MFALMYTVLIFMSLASTLAYVKGHSECTSGGSPCRKQMSHSLLPAYSNITLINEVMRRINTAVLQVVNPMDNHNITLWYQTSECHECDLKFGREVVSNKRMYLAVDTRWKTRMQIMTHKNKPLMNCNESDISRHFYEGGNYTLWLNRNTSGMYCNGPVLMNNPTNAFLPIYMSMVVLIVLILLWIFIKYLHSRHYLYYLVPHCCKTPEIYMDPDLGLPPAVNEAGLDESVHRSTRERVRSLDCFRGFSLVIMIFVNYGGGGYWFFKHSPWNGLTVADLVFPWFVFIMGTSISLSFSAQLNKNVSKKKILWKIVKRVVILFLLGLILNSSGRGNGVDLRELRIPGVLQRLALTYLVVASIHLVFVRSHDHCQYQRFSMRDITNYWMEWLIHFILIAAYLLITFVIKLPGCPRGYIGPGGWSDGDRFSNCTGGSAGHIDRLVLGDRHIYQHPTLRKIYHTKVPYDPEGILGTLTSCFICFLGLQAGKILLIYRDSVDRLSRWIIWAVLLCSIATVLCKASKDDGWIPINKNLWSLSFVLLLAGFAFLLLTLTYLAVDVYRLWSGTPFIYPGMNPIVIYMCHEIFHRYFPVYFRGYLKQHWQLLAMNIYGTALWVLLAYIMYRRRVFISI